MPAPHPGQAGGDLHGAARVGDQHGGRARGLDRRGLLALEPVGHLGLQDVVEAGGAAAAIAVLHLGEIEPWQPAEDRPRRHPDPLGVQQVAGVMQRHPPQRGARRRHDALLVEELHEVAHLGGEVGRGLAVHRVLGRQQLAWPGGTTTRQPLRASTRMVARFTGRYQRSWTQPASTATVPRGAPPVGSVTRDRRRASSRQPHAGEQPAHAAG